MATTAPKSTTLRRSIGAAAARLQRALEAAKEYSPSPDPFEDDIIDEHAELSTLHMAILKPMTKLQQLHDQWLHLMESDPNEKSVFIDFLEKTGDYTALVSQAVTTLEHMDTRLHTLETTASSLYIQLPHSQSPPGSPTQKEHTSASISDSNTSVFMKTPRASQLTRGTPQATPTVLQQQDYCQGLRSTPGHQFPAPHGHQLQSTPGHQFPAPHGHQLQSTPGQQFPTTPGHQFPAPPGHQLPTTPGHQFPAPHGYQLPIAQGLLATLDGGQPVSIAPVSLANTQYVAPETHNMNAALAQFNTLDAALLTRLDVPTFAGTIVDFPEFWTRFSALVDSKSSLDPGSKFSLLKSCLKGPALECLSGIPVTAENYSLARSILHFTYNDPSTIKHVLYSRIFNLPEADERTLPQQFAQMNGLVRQFSSLDPIDSPEHCIAAAIFNKLPRQTRLQILDKVPTNTNMTPIQLMDILGTIVRRDFVVDSMAFPINRHNVYYSSGKDPPLSISGLKLT